MPEEVRFFARSALFGLVVGVVYWFLSYDASGTVLLLAFGIAGVFLSLVVRRASGQPPQRPSPASAVELLRLAPADAANAFSDEGGWLPGPTIAPLACAAGLALGLLSLVFGPAMIVAGVPPLLVGGGLWLRAVVREQPTA